LKGHKNAITELDWMDDEYLVSCSSDKSVIYWDAESGEKIKKYQAHSKIVNCVSTFQKLFVTGSDDSNVKLWDIRSKNVVHTFKCNYPVLSVSMKENEIYSSGIDHSIKVWDLKKLENRLSLHGHQDSITGISLSPDGNSILSNSMDQTVRIFDIRPFCEGDRCKKVFYGVQHGIDKNLLRCSWSSDSKRISAGSSDSPVPYVYVWNVMTEKILYKLPGHRASINQVVFHPKEPIIASGSSDKNIFVGEILSE
jgi:Prp8 binding protein